MPLKSPGTDDGRADFATASADSAGPPLWEMAVALPDESDPPAQPVPDEEFDQRIAC